VVTAADANTKSLYELRTAGSVVSDKLTVMGQALYANTSALNSAATVYSATAVTNRDEQLMAWKGVQAAAGKGLMTEFDSYEYGWNTCLAYMTDEAVITEADPSRWYKSYSGDSRGYAGQGLGAKPGWEASNYYTDYSLEQPWIEEEKRRGIGPYASSSSSPESDDQMAKIGESSHATAENTGKLNDNVMAWGAPGSLSDSWFDQRTGMDGGGAWVGHYATAGTTGAGQTSWGGAAASEAILAAQRNGVIGGQLGQGTVNWGATGDDISEIRTWQSYVANTEENTADGATLAGKTADMITSGVAIGRGSLEVATGTKAVIDAISGNTEITRGAQAGLISTGVGNWIVTGLQSIAAARGGGGGGGYAYGGESVEGTWEGTNTLYYPSPGYSPAQVGADVGSITGNLNTLAGYDSGGVPDRKQLAWVAEDGPEAVIPLDGSRPDLVDYVLDEYGVQRFADGSIIGKQYVAQSGSGALSLSASQTWVNGQISQSSSMSGGTPLTEEEIETKLAKVDDAVSAAISNFKMALPTTLSTLVEKIFSKMSGAAGGDVINITLPPIYVGSGASVTKAEIEEMLKEFSRTFKGELASVLKESRRQRS
jgi:hypothetical protein